MASSSNYNFTPISPVRDFKGDATVEVLSTPSFMTTPSILDPIEPIELFPTPSPSSLHFSTPDYKKHFSSFLEPTPSAPMPIVNEFRWMTPSVESTYILSPTTSSDTDSPHSNSATGSLSNSNNSSSESLQFKLSQTP